MAEESYCDFCGEPTDSCSHHYELQREAEAFDARQEEDVRKRTYGLLKVARRTQWSGPEDYHFWVRQLHALVLEGGEVVLLSSLWKEDFNTNQKEWSPETEVLGLSKVKNLDKIRKAFGQDWEDPRSWNLFKALPAQKKIALEYIKEIIQ